MRKFTRYLGVDIHRYPEGDGIGRMLKLMDINEVRTVIDVGANDGAYAEALLDRGFKGEILSFEPIYSVYQVLRRKSRRHSLWSVYNYALGPSECSATINIAENGGASSSILDIARPHVDADPSSRYIREELINVRTLDQMLSKHYSADVPEFVLKLDVQGYELEVLKGAEEVFDSGLIRGIQVELSFCELYHGGACWRDILRYLDKRGFDLVFLEPGFSDQSLYLLQADGFFFLR